MFSLKRDSEYQQGKEKGQTALDDDISSTNSESKSSDVLIEISKCLERNNGDNNEVRFIQGIKDSEHFSKLFGIQGLWIDKLFTNYLDPARADGYTLGEMLNNAINLKAEPKNKTQCLAEIKQFWNKLSTEVGNSKASNTLSEAIQSELNIANDTAIALALQGEGTHNVTTTGNYSSSPFHTTGKGEDDPRKYNDDDITDYVVSVVDGGLGGYKAKCTFLLNRDFVDENGQCYKVALTPTVDKREGHGHVIDYYLDNEKQPGSSIAKALDLIDKHSESLPNDDIREKWVRDLLKSSGDYDDPCIEKAIQKLKENNYKSKALSSRDAQCGAWDVFDEIMPELLKANSDSKMCVKILFPYNISDWHWLTGEIMITKTGQNYSVSIYVHDPYGGGKLDKKTFDILKNAISKRIKKDDTSASIECKGLKSSYSARQGSGDVVSCGIITAEDIIKRIQGKTLNIESTYPAGAVDLRKLHIEKLVSFRKKEDVVVKRFQRRFKEAAIHDPEPSLKPIPEIASIDMEGYIEELKAENKKQDINALYQMWNILEDYEKGLIKNADVALKGVAGLCGGASGVTFRENDSKCIRRRYGRKTEDAKLGFINFEYVHRAFMLLEFGKVLPPEEIKGDLEILKSKIVYILVNEIKQHPDSLPALLSPQEWNLISTQPSSGNDKELEVIYKYVKDHYYSLSISRIKEELKTLQGQVINDKDDLYFFGRKVIIIGELCREITEELKGVEGNDPSSYTVLKDILTDFDNIKKERNHFVHPAALVDQFLNADKENVLKQRLYDNIKKIAEGINKEEIEVTLISACKNIGISKTFPKNTMLKEKKADDIELELIKLELKNSEEYKQLLDACRIASSSLTPKQQQLIKFGETPDASALINVGDDLSIFTKVNNLKMLRVRKLHESKIKGSSKYKETFDKLLKDRENFDITSLEDCKGALEQLATLEVKNEWKLKDEYSLSEGKIGSNGIKKLFSRIGDAQFILDTINGVYQKGLKDNLVYQEPGTDLHITSCHKLKEALEKFAELKDEKWVVRPGKKGNDIFTKMTNNYRKLKKIEDDHNNDLKQCSYYKEAVSIITSGIEAFEIINKDALMPALYKIADYTKSMWMPKDKKDAEAINILSSAYKAHAIKDPKELKERVYKELNIDKARLLKAIHEEMQYALQIDSKDMHTSKKRAIKEYAITVIGQYMRDLSDTTALKHILETYTASSAGFLMRALRSKGLAHEVLRFCPEQLDEQFKNVILPAVQDFAAINTVSEWRAGGMPNTTGIAYAVGANYVRLGLYKEAIECFKRELKCLDEDQSPTNIVTEGELALLKLACRVYIMSDLTVVYKFIRDYESDLTEIDKVLSNSNINALASFKNPSFLRDLAKLYIRKGEYLYYVKGDKGSQETIDAYRMGFKLASDTPLYSDIVITGGDRMCELMRDTNSRDDALLAEIYDKVVIIEQNESYAASPASLKFKLLSLKARIALLKNDGFLENYNNLLLLLSNKKAKLVDEMGDRYHLLTFEAFIIKLEELKAKRNLSETINFGEELKKCYLTLKGFKVAKDPSIGHCFLVYSDILIELSKDFVTAIKAKEYISLASNAPVDRRVQAASNLVFRLYDLWALGNKNECEGEIAALGKLYNLPIQQFLNLHIESYYHYRNATLPVSKEEKEKHYISASQCLKDSKKSLKNLRDNNLINLADSSLKNYCNNTLKNLGICYTELALLLHNMDYCEKAKSVFKQISQEHDDTVESYLLKIDNFECSYNAAKRTQQNRLILGLKDNESYLLRLLSRYNLVCKKMKRKPSTKCFLEIGIVDNPLEFDAFLHSIGIPEAEITLKNSNSIVLNLQEESIKILNSLSQKQKEERLVGK